MQKFSLLGSTGSIGTQTLDIVREHHEKFEVVAIAAGRNIELLAGEWSVSSSHASSCHQTLQLQFF